MRARRRPPARVPHLRMSQFGERPWPRHASTRSPRQRPRLRPLRAGRPVHGLRRVGPVRVVERQPPLAGPDHQGRQRPRPTRSRPGGLACPPPPPAAPPGRVVGFLPGTHKISRPLRGRKTSDQLAGRPVDLAGELVEVVRGKQATDVSLAESSDLCGWRTESATPAARCRPDGRLCASHASALGRPGGWVAAGAGRPAGGWQGGRLGPAGRAPGARPGAAGRRPAFLASIR
jgi:hypothetical protein